MKVVPWVLAGIIFCTGFYMVVNPTAFEDWKVTGESQVAAKEVVSSDTLVGGYEITNKEEEVNEGYIEDTYEEVQEEVIEIYEVKEENENIVTAAATSKKQPNMISLGKPKEKNDYIGGIYVDGSTIYAKDGMQIVKIDGNKQSVYFDLKDLVLPKHLDNKMSRRSINISQMEKVGNDLILSGFIYEDRQGLGEMTKTNRKIAGHTYTILFKISKGKGTVLHLSLTRINAEYKSSDFFETDGGIPKDIFEWEDGMTLYAYWMHSEKPRFTYSNGRIIFVRDWNRGLGMHSDGTADSWIDIIELHNGKETVLYRFYESSVDYRLPILKGDILTVYSGTRVENINLATNERVTDNMPRGYVLKRPIYRNGKVYCLTDRGLASVTRLSNGEYNFSTLVKAEDTDISAYIPAYDVANGQIYLADFYERGIHVLKP